MKNENIIIIEGETGSGKTTQIPQFLLNTELTRSGMIAVTQPRRIAALSIAKRVAEETDTTLGEQIGYSIRFDDRTSGNTLLKYMTDGMLIRELILDRNLKKYSVIMLDEAHERTLNTDILLGILKELVKTRKSTLNPLKLIIMSATIEVDKFVNYFDKKSPVLSIPGRQYPVDIFYTPKAEEDYLEAAIKTAVQIHVNEDPGDILIFLTGEHEIETAVYKISHQVGLYENECDPVQILPLYGAMSITN